jgi:hypothetical protein
MTTDRNITTKAVSAGRRSAGKTAKSASMLVLAGALVAACGTGAAAAHHSSANANHKSGVPAAPRTTKPGRSTKSPISKTSSHTQTSGKGSSPAHTASAVQPVTAVPTYAPTSPIETGWGKPSSSIPWSHVGSGWTLDVWSPVASQQAYDQRLKETTTLYLVAPSGARYEEAVFKPGQFVQVADWAGDRQQAVVTSTVDTAYVTASQVTTVTDLDLVTGATVGSFAVKNLSNVTFTKPDGLALVANFGGGTSPDSLDRLSVTGSTELNFPTTFPVVGSYSGSAIYTPDGTDLVMGAASGLAVVSNAGPIVAELPIAGTLGGCTVQSWWTTGVAVAACSSHGTPTYFAVPLSGAKPYAIASEPMPAHLWHIPSGTYSENAACGIEWIVKLGAKGVWNRIELPGVLQSQSQFVAGTYNDMLLTVATPSCGSGKNPPAPSLMLYDPMHNKTTVLLGTSVNGGAVLDVLEFSSVPLYVG